jgi:uncharacterized protein with GYD domain
LLRRNDIGKYAGSERMKFVTLVKFKKKITKEIIAQNLKQMEQEAEKEGVKVTEIFWTLGRYDAVVIMEAPDEKAAMKTSIRRAENMSLETLVAIPAVEARKLVD